MKAIHHILLGIVLFGLYVLITHYMYLYMYRHACQDAGGVYQEAYRLCSGLVTQEPDFGAHMSYLRWLVLLGLPAVLMVAVQLSVHALFVALGHGRRSSRGRRRVYRTPN